jgi:hypothetical protein
LHASPFATSGLATASLLPPADDIVLPHSACVSSCAVCSGPCGVYCLGSFLPVPRLKPNRVSFFNPCCVASPSSVVSHLSSVSVRDQPRAPNSTSEQHSYPFTMSAEKSDGKKDGGGRFGFSKMMGDIKDKLHDTKLEDAKVKLIHQKSVLASSSYCSFILTTFKAQDWKNRKHCKSCAILPSMHLSCRSSPTLRAHREPLNRTHATTPRQSTTKTRHH